MLLNVCHLIEKKEIEKKKMLVARNSYSCDEALMNNKGTDQLQVGGG